jgi:molybdopterin-synthase adenylyltransferase
MPHRRSDCRDYLRRYAAHIPALGERGQLRLRRAHAVVVGAGGAGSFVCVILAGLGIGRITAIDPQVVERDNFNRLLFARDRDIGVSKVSVLKQFLGTRSHLRFETVEGAAESRKATKQMGTADVIVSASNSASSRLAAARVARRRRIPHVFAGVHDGRVALGGTVGIWLPERPELACQGCFLDAGAVPRGEALVTTAVMVIAGLAADVVRQLLTVRPRDGVVGVGNLRTLDLERSIVEAVRVLRNPECSVCSDPRRMCDGRSAHRP